MMKIFISYCHKDEPWKDQLVEHLKVLELEDYSAILNLKKGLVM